MRPKKPVSQPQSELFNVRLEVICIPSNPLVKFADQMDWDALDEQFAALYSEDGRPATSTRMMIGLTLLQSLYGLSEDEVVDRWPENPYWISLRRDLLPAPEADCSKWTEQMA